MTTTEFDTAGLSIDKNIPADEYDAFIDENGCLLQTRAWTKVKDNWENEILGVRKDGKLVASAQILKRQLPLGYKMYYIPRGPVGDYENGRDAIAFLLKEIKKEGKKDKAVFIKIDPEVLINEWQFKKERPESKSDLPQFLKETVGAEHFGYNLDMYETVQPRITMGVHLEDDFRKGYARNAKRGIKTANKFGIQVKRYSIAENKEECIKALDEFSRLMHCTEEKKHVALRDKEYFLKMLEAYPKDACLFIASTDFDKAKASGNLSDKEMKLAEDKHGVASMCGLLTVNHGDKMELLYMGNDPAYSFCNAAPLTYDVAYQYAKDLGLKYADMSGVQGTLDDGLAKHKASYGAVVQEYVGEFDIPVNSLLYKIILPIYKKKKAE